MKVIQLTKGKETIVDDEDYEYLSQFKWYYHHTGYAVRNSPRPNRKTIPMHRVITNCPKNMQVDHINEITLDNRKSNLRICEEKENSRNKSKKNIKSSSIYKGVFYNPKNKNWRAYIGFNYKRINLGSFKSEMDAAKAYNDAAIKYHKEFAKLNNV